MFILFFIKLVKGLESVGNIDRRYRKIIVMEIIIINNNNVVYSINLVMVLIIIHLGMKPVIGGIPPIDMNDVTINMFIVMLFRIIICAIVLFFVLLNVIISGIVIIVYIMRYGNHRLFFINEEDNIQAI